MFELRGKIEFDPINITKKHEGQSSWKKIVIVKFNDDICEYYSWFLKTRFDLILNKPLRGSHITIINDRCDDDIYIQAREIFNNKEIIFEYDPIYIRSNDKGHWWIRAYSQDAANIRNVMGLNDPFFGLHLTIGKANEQNLEHSKYITRQCIKFDL